MKPRCGPRAITYTGFGRGYGLPAPVVHRSPQPSGRGGGGDRRDASLSGHLRPTHSRVVALLAMIALVQDRNTRTWAVVMGLTTVAAVGYGAYQEHVAARAISVARRRLRGMPFDELRREMDRAATPRAPLLGGAHTLIGSEDLADQATATLLTALKAPDARRSALRSIDRWWRSANNLYPPVPETSADSARMTMRRLGATRRSSPAAGRLSRSRRTASPPARSSRRSAHDRRGARSCPCRSPEAFADGRPAGVA